ncbi:hypothetical protein B0H19DRAFT_134306 [Mycena capillaripes]|nr:hypothetical protein B0H19DRAFT_134306 [Mycena capillaripes]
MSIPLATWHLIVPRARFAIRLRAWHTSHSFHLSRLFSAAQIVVPKIRTCSFTPSLSCACGGLKDDDSDARMACDVPYESYTRRLVLDKEDDVPEAEDGHKYLTTSTSAECVRRTLSAPSDGEYVFSLLRIRTWRAEGCEGERSMQASEVRLLTSSLLYVLLFFSHSFICFRISTRVESPFSFDADVFGSVSDVHYKSYGRRRNPETQIRIAR